VEQIRYVVGKNNVASGDEGRQLGNYAPRLGIHKLLSGTVASANSAYSNGTIAMGFNFR
jgi:hypothetical protein